MIGYIGVTDRNWFEALRAIGPSLEEMNFWQPSAGRMLRLESGTPFFFKLKKNEGDAIVGFAIYARGVRMPIREAWSFFGRANGCGSMEELRASIAQYRSPADPRSVTISAEIGCHLLIAPVLFHESHWITPPDDWSYNLTQGHKRRLDEGEMARIWAQCQAALPSADVGDQSRLQLQSSIASAALGKPVLVQPRVGQGTFRAVTMDAYGGACAVTTEHSRPVLEAAHIVPYAHSHSHDIRNGLLLRADVHKLFDAGYVTVTPDGNDGARFIVSDRLREEFSNGRIYYEKHGEPIRLPDRPELRPDPNYLRWHNDHVFEQSGASG